MSAEEENAAELKIGEEFLKAKCLMNGEVEQILEKRLEQLQHTTEDPLNQVSQYHLAEFELCVLGNLCPETVEEAIAMVPSIKLQAQAPTQDPAHTQAHAATRSGLLGHTELRLHMPPSLGLAMQGRLQGLRLQLALLNRELDDLDYDTLRALDSDNRSGTPSITEEEINALPVHKHRAQTQNGTSNSQSGESTTQPTSSSVATNETKQDSLKSDGNIKPADDELTCSVCLVQVNVGELLRSLPCLHQFHASCIDSWLRQRGTCHVCKHRVGSGWYGSGESEADASYMAKVYVQEHQPVRECNSQNSSSGFCHFLTPSSSNFLVFRPD